MSSRTKKDTKETFNYDPNEVMIATPDEMLAFVIRTFHKNIVLPLMTGSNSLLSCTIFGMN